VAILQPDRLLNPIDHAPKNVALYQEARQVVLGRPPASLRVETVGDGAFQVEVDGKDLGPAPVLVSDLPAGRHYLRVLGEGAWRSHGSLVLREGEERLVQVEPERGTLGHTAGKNSPEARLMVSGQMQLGLFGPEPSALDEAVKDLDPENMTPMEALAKVRELKDLI
jgi:hypothetical protein